MIAESQQEHAGLYALGSIPEAELAAFDGELRANSELESLVRDFQEAAVGLARSGPMLPPPKGLRQKVLNTIDSRKKVASGAIAAVAAQALSSGLRFERANETKGWKQLPIRGAWIKLLSLEPKRGYAVLLGKLEPGVRYPAHVNARPEDFVVLSGDLNIGGQALGPGDFHHADAGSQHTENYSIAGCTLVAVLPMDDPLVAFAQS